MKGAFFLMALLLLGSMAQAPESISAKSLRSTDSNTLKIIFSLLYISILVGVIIAFLWLMIICSKMRKNLHFEAVREAAL